ncbi:MAG: sporulation protein YqfD [Oscillospiraceae bacterium]
MFLVRCLRYVRGSVTFLILGAFPERLVNLCICKRVPLWGVHPAKGGCEANTYASRYRRLRPLTKQAGVRTRVTVRRGWPFLRRRYRRRWGIAVGFVLAVLLLPMLSSRIWSVEVEGCQIIDQSEVVTALDTLGLYPGVSARSIDVHVMQRRMMLLDGRIAWIAINLMGSTAHVQVKERTMPPEPIDISDRVANIVAACDGQLRVLEVYEGQALVRVGNTVSKGEVIVSGVMQDGHNNTRLVYARAKAVAQVYDTVRVEAPQTRTALRPAGKTTCRWTLRLAGVRLPLSLPGATSREGEFHEETQMRRLWNRPIVEWEMTETTPMERYTEILTEEEARAHAARMLAMEEHLRLQGGALLQRREETSCERGVCVMTAELLLERDIAQTAEIFIN